MAFQLITIECSQAPLGNRKHSTSESTHGELTTLMLRPLTQESIPGFSHVIKLVEELQQKPSCHRLATSTLIDNCQTLTPAHPDPNNALESVHSIHAARLAVCELKSAFVEVPEECELLMPRQRPPSSKTNIKCYFPGSRCSFKPPNSEIDESPFEYGDTTQMQIHKCLRVLESRPQWWTSYSNAFQNAIPICRAARAEIDREELLTTGATIFTLFQNISNILQDSEQQRFEERLNATLVALQWQEKLQHNVEETQSMLGAFFSDIAKQLSSLSFTLSSLLSSVTSEVQSLTSKLNQTSSTVDETRTKLVSLWKDTEAHNNALAESQTKTWASQKDLSLGIQSQLDSIQHVQMRDLVSTLGNIYEYALEGHERSVANNQLQEAQFADHSRRLASLSESIEVTKLDVEAIGTTINSFRHALDEQLKVMSSLPHLGQFGGLLRLLPFLILAGFAAFAYPSTALFFTASAGATWILVNTDWSWLHGRATTVVVEEVMS